MPSDSPRPVTLAELVATLSLAAGRRPGRAGLGDGLVLRGLTSLPVILGPGRGYALARRGQ